MQSVRFLAERAREVSVRLGLLSGVARNEILLKIAERLEQEAPRIIKANKKDLSDGKKKKLPTSLLDRLMLDKARIRGIAGDVRNVATLPDPLGKNLESRILKSGMSLKRVSVPIGVIGMIYEARPNVTVDAASLCIKSGNAVILKGGSDAAHSNRVLAEIIREVLQETAFLEPESRLQDAVQLIDSTDRSAVGELLKLHGLVDVIIPRGSAGLINFVRENSTIPVIETGASVVHTYIHNDADIAMAVKIVMNAKLRRVGICNALDSLLVHQEIAPHFLEALTKTLPKNRYKATRLELRADGKSYTILDAILKKRASAGSKTGSKTAKNFKLTLKKSTAQDYHTEFLDYVLAVKIVHTLDEAIGHISHHSLKHSEAIVCKDRRVASRFLTMVDAAAVYWNASTQFSDGAQFGLGAEIGISTQKLHVRGPFALEGLTSYKWIIEGNGTIRG